MNKIFLSFGMFLVLCLAACGGKTNGNNDESQLADTDTINGEVMMDEISPEQTVEYYYGVIVRRYMEEHVTSQMSFLDFCSADLKEKLKLANKLERIYHEQGPCDYDIWINAKVFDNLSLKGIDLYSTDDGTTEVEVTLRNTGQENKIYVTLVNENGLWMIDDLKYPGDNKKESDLKELIEEYIEGKK